VNALDFFKNMARKEFSFLVEKFGFFEVAPPQRRIYKQFPGTF